MAKPCNHQTGFDETCRVCFLAAYHPEYRKRWGLEPEQAFEGAAVAFQPRDWSKHKRKKNDCVYFDDSVQSRIGPEGLEVKCQSKWLYTCDLFGQCARGEEAERPGVRACRTCDRYTPEIAAREQIQRLGVAPPEIEAENQLAELAGPESWLRPEPPTEVEQPRMPVSVAADKWTRHLAYIIMPINREETWQRNLDQLISRMPMFNGRKVVAIIKQGDAEYPVAPPEAVKEYLRGWDCEFMEFENEKALREVKAFVPMLEKIREAAGARPDHCCFHAHAKGVTKAFDPGVTVHTWATLMYHTLLDYWPLVSEMLLDHPFVGSFKKLGRAFGPKTTSDWHYSGTFYWIRTGALFGTSDDWKRIDQQWWGTESYPSLHCPRDRAACVFHTAQAAALNCYKMAYFTRIILPEFAKWKRDNRRHLLPIG